MNTYKYDLHVHTDETSPCGMVKAKDLVHLYKNEGYDGIVITDHYFDYFFTSLGKMAWKDKTARYLEGFRKAHAEGIKIGLTVISGMEIRFEENYNDYLVYGLDEQFLLDHPELYRLGLSGFRKLIAGTGVLLFQAHPYRSGMVVADPAFLDGVEVYNGNPRHNSHNEKAELFAAKHGLLGISGSDFHQPEDIARGGVLLPEPVHTAGELVAALKFGKAVDLIHT